MKAFFDMFTTKKNFFLFINLICDDKWYFMFFFLLFARSKRSKKSRQNMLPPALSNHVIDSQSSTSPFDVNYHDCLFTLAQCAHFAGASALRLTI